MQTAAQRVRERADCIAAAAQHDHELRYAAGMHRAAACMDPSGGGPQALQSLIDHERDLDIRRGMRKAQAMWGAQAEWSLIAWVEHLDASIGALEARIAGLEMTLGTLRPTILSKEPHRG
jgi:hypothetical protein